MVNSRQPHVAATLSSSRSKSYHPRGHAFSRSYGIILQSSLTTVLSSALGYSPHPPVSVWGTDILNSKREVFLGSMGSTSNAALERLAPHHTLVLTIPRFDPKEPTYVLRPGRPEPGWYLYPSPSLLASTNLRRYRNFNLFSIAYAIWPRLRVRLTLGGLS